MNPFEGWANFYVIVGSSAGALIGLQFVVVTLIAETPAMRDQARANAAFGTPTIVHFWAVLLLSALASIPWRGVTAAAGTWGTMGVAGIVYCVVVIRRMLVQAAYKPEREDWLFHAVIPLGAYAAL